MFTGSQLRRSAAVIGGALALALVGLVPGTPASAGSTPATGRFDRLIGVGDGVNWGVSGWAVDLDTPTSPVTVTTTVDGVVVATTVASGVRDDVAARYPSVGAAHGFDIAIKIPAAAGAHTVCVSGTNTDGSGATSLFGCKIGHSAGVAAPTATTTATTPTTTAATVPAAPANRPATGTFDRLFGSSVAHTWTMTGWAVDLDTPSTAVVVNVSVDGVFVNTMTASESRSDVAARYPFVGAAHGYTITMPMPAAGRHIVCVSAVDTSTKTGSLLGCRQGTSS
ncbi:MAG: N-acetylmuramoyl-L-alanine amidase, family 2 [Ilumatobacteraceae bacterium]|nr:N-acetylmuramoyl-L-alanine amidase, family 2 [Ilumatobacteraceae bacterium]